MIYRVEISKATKGKYLISARGESCLVDREFLEKNMPGKLQYVDRDGWTTVRAEWDLSKQTKETKSEVSKIKKTAFGEVVDPDYEYLKQELHGGEYQIVESKNFPKLYELWHKNEKYGYYNFIVYFFDLDLAEALIREYEMWQKFEKIHGRNLGRDSYQPQVGDKETVDEE